MSFRVYTEPYVEIILRDDIVRRVSNFKWYDYPEWEVTDDGRLSLSEGRFAGKAFFRLVAYAGSGVMFMEFEEGDENNKEESELHSRYHIKMLDLLYGYFQGRFYLVEQTPCPSMGLQILT